MDRTMLAENTVPCHMTWATEARAVQARVVEVTLSDNDLRTRKTTKKAYTIVVTRSVMVMLHRTALKK
jgi:hypothetical protein